MYFRVKEAKLFQKNTETVGKWRPFVFCYDLDPGHPSSGVMHVMALTSNELV